MTTHPRRPEPTPMHRSLRYMKSAAKALSKVLARSVANALEIPEYAVEIPLDLAWEWGEQLRADLAGESSEQVRREYQEVIKPGPDYSEDELIEAVNAGFLGAPEPVRMTALALLGQIQSQGRQSLKRLDDPSGTSLPDALRFDSVEDHAARLPNTLPRYNVGDQPIQGYKLAERLGVGGFGEVWKAHSPRSASMDVVALKFFTDARACAWLTSHEADVLERVQTEVSHEGIVRLLNVYDDLACLKFEYVRGWTLARQILDWHAQGPPHARFIAGEFRRIVEILVDVHEIKPVPIVHRDLKPANILVETLPGGKLRYRITDFGIGGFAAGEVARHTRMGTVDRPRNPSLLRGAHSPLYASDEQKRGLDPDPRDDIFSLGVLWHQMQTGRLDSGPPTGFGWSKQLVKDGLSQELVELMASCFESRARDRPASARVLLERLQELLTPRVEIVTPPSPEPERPRVDLVPPPRLDPLPDLITSKVAAIPLKLIPAGSFLMGSPEGVGHNDERPQHKVTITRPFYLGATPVTVGQFRQFVEGSGYKTDVERTGKGYGWNAKESKFEQGAEYTWRSPGFSQTDDHPVVLVSHNDAVALCDWLSQQEGETYRLPTEAEWEYACRAGTGGSGAYGFGDDARQLGRHAWYSENSGNTTHPVGQKAPNAWGLFDMHGHVWEWCADWFDEGYYAESPTDDPRGPETGSNRVLRGGSWGSDGGSCRSAYRSDSDPSIRGGNLGFRVARVPSGRQERDK